MVEEHLELWLGLIACIVLGVAYAFYAVVAEPAGGHPFGQFMGIVGMALMVVTELVYSIRKRVRWLHWMGSLRAWLSFHIFTGIVGPFLVLLHSAFAFGGLAGIALQVSGIVVLSGFLGRYIYTSVPRTRAGIEVSREELAARAAALEAELDAWVTQKPAVVQAFGGVMPPGSMPDNWFAVFTRSWVDIEYDRHVSAALHAVKRAEQAHSRELRLLLRRQRRLERQIASLEWVHKLMGVWRLIHIPLGITLFTTAIIHIVAAFYFKGLPF